MGCDIESDSSLVVGISSHSDNDNAVPVEPDESSAIAVFVPWDNANEFSPDPDKTPVADVFRPSVNADRFPSESEKLSATDVAMPSVKADAPPILIGMAKSEVARFYRFIGGEFLLLTSPAQLSPTRTVVWHGTVRFRVAFDEDDRVCAIHTNDRSFILPNGIGVGSTYADIKQLGRYFVVFRFPGYGRMVKLEEGILLGFHWKSREETYITDDEKVLWIEFDRTP
jgi:hypothetical protein